jgi:Zn-dependent protease
MRWSIPIGRVFGITLRLHVTFLLLLAWVAYEAFGVGGVSAARWELARVCLVFACIALHELGHSVVAQQLDVEVKSITLLPIGGVAALRRIPENPWHEIAITLAGPMVNAAIAVVLFPFAGMPSLQELVTALVTIPHSLGGLTRALVGTNIALFVFNFIPAFPMDGGRLLRATLALALSYRRATAIAATVGQGIAILFVLFGWMKFNAPILIIIGVFIFLGAEGEERMVRMRSLLRELEVEDVMSRDFAVLAPQAKVTDGLRMVYQTGQDDFPVMDGDQLVGLVSRSAMVEAANKTGPDITVADVMDTEVPVVSPQDKVAHVYEEMMSEGHTSFPVLGGDRVIGLLSPENISRYMLVQSSLKSGGRGRIRRSAAGRTPTPPPLISAAPPVASPPPHEESAPPSARA